MRITTILTASAIALAAGVGSASADENFITLDGISAFESFAGIQAVPLDTDEMASITASHWLKVKNGTSDVTDLNNTNGIWDIGHRGDGVKFFGKGGTIFVSTIDSDKVDFALAVCIHGGGGGCFD